MRVQIISALTLAVAAGGMASCAPTPSDMGGDGAAPARACFYPSTVVNFRTSGDNIAYIKAGRNEIYELRAAGFCRGLSAARSLAISETPGMGSRACVGDTVNVIASAPSLDDSTNLPCRAQVARKLTDEEVAALPDRLRPN
ncbi:MAG TPA: DUF6491 family protein [Brevundimonas sp.]